MGAQRECLRELGRRLPPLELSVLVGEGSHVGGGGGATL